jgi:hypothetical protein
MNQCPLKEEAQAQFEEPQAGKQSVEVFDKAPVEGCSEVKEQVYPCKSIISSK